METPDKHVKEMFDKRFLIAEMFDDGLDRVYTIVAVAEEEIVNPANGTKDTRPILYFEETDKVLGLNQSNANTLIKLFGTGRVKKWVGEKIQLYVTTTKAFGDQVLCIRIRNYKPILKCAVCGRDIDLNTYLHSIKKYKTPFCSKECLDKAMKDEDLI